MITITCQRCGSPFEVYEGRRNTALYCSLACRRNRVSKTCEICGAAFEVKASHADNLYCCSTKCGSTRRRRLRQTEIERQFGKPIFALLFDLYCVRGMGIKRIAATLDMSDHALWNWFDDLGIERRTGTDAVALQWTPERRRSWSLRMRSDMESGKRDRYFLVTRARTPEVRRRISESKTGPLNAMYGRFGRRNPNWQGGKITYRGAGWRGIRAQAIRRDGNKCQLCGCTELLQVHHITPYRETQDNSLANLVTLCASCHMKVEHG